jgi:hypothetical protein
MKDLLGNTITEGGFAYWKSKELLVQVLKIIEENNPPVLVLAVQVPIQGTPRDQEVIVGDLLCVINPDSERALEKMLEGRPMQ